jgi:EAL domain-containing protein (putative c-di-GMP-specific phosphodiesterase class I)
VFVNVDDEDLLDGELVGGGGALADFASRVVLEITERAQLDRIPHLSGRLTRLRDQGFRLAIDDLGAGYSGNVNLAILEPDVVKLDMALVRGVDRETSNRDVVRSVIRLCKKLRCVIVAEGVETEAERDTLVELGCDALQGFLLARPARVPLPVRW